MRIISGEFARRILQTPKNFSTRPTSDKARESLFNVLSNFGENFFSKCRVLDLFAGTGALGLEALSRGVKEAFFIEKNYHACALINQNIKNLGLEKRAYVFKSDATNFKNFKFSDFFDIIFADPPYNQSLGEKAFKNVLAKGWANEFSFFILEESKKAKILKIEGLNLVQQLTSGKTLFSIYKRSKSEDEIKLI